MKRSSRILILLAALSLSLGCASQTTPAPQKPPAILPQVKATPYEIKATVEDLALKTIESAQMSLTYTGIAATILGVIITIMIVMGVGNFFYSKKTREEAEKTKENTKRNWSYSEAISFAQTALRKGEEKEVLLVDCYPAIQRLKAIEAEFPVDRVLHIYLGRLYRRLRDYDSAIRALRDFITNLECDPKLKIAPGARIDIADANYNVACYHALKAKQKFEEKQSQVEINRLIEEAIGFLRIAIEGNPQNLQAALDDQDFDFIRDRVNREFGERTKEN